MLRVIFGEDSLLWPVSSHLACENIRFSSLFVASDEEQSEEKRMFLQATSHPVKNNANRLVSFVYTQFQ